MAVLTPNMVITATVTKISDRNGSVRLQDGKNIIVSRRLKSHCRFGSLHFACWAARRILRLP